MTCKPVMNLPCCNQNANKLNVRMQSSETRECGKRDKSIRFNALLTMFNRTNHTLPENATKLGSSMASLKRFPVCKIVYFYKVYNFVVIICMRIKTGFFVNGISVFLALFPMPWTELKYYLF